MTKTDQVFKYLRDNPLCSPYRACHMIGLTPSVFYRAAKKRGVPICPMCRRPWPQKCQPVEPD